MNIIVTGGAGFIGSNFVFHILKKYPDYRIICLDKLTYAGNLSTLAPVMDECERRASWAALPEAVSAVQTGSCCARHGV